MECQPGVQIPVLIDGIYYKNSIYDEALDFGAGAFGSNILMNSPISLL